MSPEKNFTCETANSWYSKYSERKITEHSIYSKKDFELWNFINIFYDKNGLIVKTCLLNYSTHVIYIFISFHQKLNINFVKNPKKKSISLIKSFFENILRFASQSLKISLTIQKLRNGNLSKIFCNKRIVTKMLVRLQRYKKRANFQEAIHVMLSCVLHKNASKLLSYLINELRHFKNQNVFLKFIKYSLIIIKNTASSKLKGIKIIIKGRLNGRPRTRKKIISIFDNASTKNSKIDYAESTSFTKNGTIGVKTWINEN